MMDTRVVESPRVRAAVKSAHISALKSRFMPKKKPRTARSMGVLSAERPRAVAMWEESVDVRDVVVLLGRVSSRYRGGVSEDR